MVLFEDCNKWLVASRVLQPHVLCLSMQLFFFFPSLSQAAKFGHLNGPKNMEEATQAKKSKLDSLPLTGTVYLKKTEYE